MKRPELGCSEILERASLESHSGSPSELFLSASISRNEHFSTNSEWRRKFFDWEISLLAIPPYRGKKQRGFVLLTSLRTKTRCVLALLRAKQMLVPGWTESRHTFSVPCRTPTFTGRRAYVSADAVDDGFAWLDKNETSLCQPSASNKMASFVVALRISTWHDLAFHPVWSFSPLTFENSAKFVSHCNLPR